jgi:hypothetical protein
MFDRLDLIWSALRVRVRSPLGYCSSLGKAFNPAEVIECAKEAPGLRTGSPYVVEAIIRDPLVIAIAGSDLCGVKVYGIDRVFHHSYFRKAGPSLKWRAF